MAIDSGMVAIGVTTLLALLGFAAAWGILTEKVRNNHEKMNADYKMNREDHQLIFSKLSDIEKTLTKSKEQ